MADSPSIKTKRTLPMEKIARRMTRSDSLSSVAEFHRVVPLEQQEALRKKKRRSLNPFEPIIKALTGN